MIANMFSSHAQLVTVGQSYEGRDILGVRLGSLSKPKEDSSHQRKTILVTGGAHAREWISISSVNFLLYTMATMYQRSELYTSLIDDFNWVFIPIQNPDGYEYTWDSDRLWRKNRQPTSLRFCKGIDLDRSYGFHFDSAPTSNPCSGSFGGEDAWDAVESAQIKQWVFNQTESGTEFVAYLDLHSYSQQILYPYSYTCETAPPTVETLQELAMGLAKAMRISSPHASTYQVTPACKGNVAADGITALPPLERGGGSALDWFYHEVGVKYAFQIKLRDTGSYGFLLPREYIVPVGKEMIGAVTYLGRFLRGEIGIATDSTLPLELDGAQGQEDSTLRHHDNLRNSRFWPTRLDFRRRR
jgi:extracellular matrix protein 14